MPVQSATLAPEARRQAGRRMSYLLVLPAVLVLLLGAGMGYLCFVQHPVRLGPYTFIGPRDERSRKRLRFENQMRRLMQDMEARTAREAARVHGKRAAFLKAQLARFNAKAEAFSRQGGTGGQGRIVWEGHGFALLRPE